MGCCAVLVPRSLCFVARSRVDHCYPRGHACSTVRWWWLTFLLLGALRVPVHPSPAMLKFVLVAAMLLLALAVSGGAATAVQPKPAAGQTARQQQQA